MIEAGIFEEALASQARILQFYLAEYEERLAAFSQTIFVSPQVTVLADSKTPQAVIVCKLAFEEQNIQKSWKVPISF